MNKLTKVLIGGAVLISTVCAGVYVNHVYDTQHTIDVPMQVSGAYGQNLNNVVGCFWLGATSRSVYEEVRHFTTSMNPIDPTTNAPQYPLWNMLDEVDKGSKEWARKYFNQFTPEQMTTTEPSIKIVEMCKQLEKKAFDDMEDIKNKYNKPLLFWK